MGNKITIVGGGLSGMVAAINLCRAGHEVEIWDGAKTLGQLEPFHPSVHATPIDPQWVSEYVNIDISPCFTRTKSFRSFIEKSTFDMNPGDFYLVERGGRKTSIDSHLYNIVKELGITYRFNHYVKDLKDIPERAILATGFDKYGMDAIGVQYETAEGAYARKKIDDPRYEAALMGWFGKFSEDYGYLSVANDLMYFLVFTRRPISDQNIADCKRHLEETDGLTFPQWSVFRGYLPILARDSLRLYTGRRVLAGTMSGMIDPMGMFGICGALVSGKIASLAFTDKEQALKDFKEFNKNYQKVRIVSAMMRRMPGRLALSHFMTRFPRLMQPLMGLIDDGIPGHNHHYTRDLMVGSKQVKN
jgi:flavin-dependent dehydrogenase